jgi:hypothetical protein
MRKYIDIITEASFPPTDYGYWISQYAEVYPVGDHGHERFIKQVENCNSGEAMMDGWVRVVTVGSVFQAEACFPRLKPRVKSTLAALARSGDWTQFIVDNHDGTGEYTINRYEMRHDFNRGIEKLSQPAG